MQLVCLQLFVSNARNEMQCAVMQCSWQMLFTVDGGVEGGGERIKGNRKTIYGIME